MECIANDGLNPGYENVYLKVKSYADMGDDSSRRFYFLLGGKNVSKEVTSSLYETIRKDLEPIIIGESDRQTFSLSKKYNGIAVFVQSYMENDRVYTQGTDKDANILKTYEKIQVVAGAPFSKAKNTQEEMGKFVEWVTRMQANAKGCQIDDWIGEYQPQLKGFETVYENMFGIETKRSNKGREKEGDSVPTSRKRKAQDAELGNEQELNRAEIKRIEDQLQAIENQLAQANEHIQSYRLSIDEDWVSEEDKKNLESHVIPEIKEEIKRLEKDQKELLVKLAEAMVSEGKLSEQKRCKEETFFVKSQVVSGEVPEFGDIFEKFQEILITIQQKKSNNQEPQYSEPNDEIEQPNTKGLNISEAIKILQAAARKKFTRSAINKGIFLAKAEKNKELGVSAKAFVMTKAVLMALTGSYDQAVQVDGGYKLKSSRAFTVKEGEMYNIVIEKLRNEFSTRQQVDSEEMIKFLTDDNVKNSLDTID